MEEEAELESSATREGITKYFNKLETAEDRSIFMPELKRLRTEVPLLAKAIVVSLMKAGRSAKLKKEMLGGIRPEEIALIVIRYCYNHYLGDQTIQKMSIQLMDEIRIHKDDRHFKEAYPAYHAVLLRNLKSDNLSYRHRVLTHTRHKMGIKDTKWDTHNKLMVGSILLDLFCLSCGSFYKADFKKPGKRYDTKTKKAYDNYGVTLRPTQETLDWLDRNHQHCSKLSPVLKPMVVPPVPWTDPWNGGYVSIARQHNSSCRFIRRVSNKWLEQNASLIDPQVYEAVNYVQTTPYRVNKKVLAVMRQLTGSGLAGLPDGKPVDLLLPPKLSPAEAKDEKKLKAWKRVAAGIYTRYFKAVAQKTAHAERMRLANMYKDKERFWFPVNLDWRGRLFTMSSPFMSPQGDDPAKGLLEYGNGKEITAEGYIEYCIHGANVYGEDKLPEMARVAWVEKNHANILEVAADPLGAIREWWTEADKPWQFLAFCFDYAAYIADRSHKSHLICHIDATCSGLQHWSAVLHDEKGAGRVGMVPKAMPDDVYQAVADRVEERIKYNNDPIAVAWRGKVTRTITKRNVMTKLYGATMPGMREQVHAELEKLDKKSGGRYLEGCPVDNFKAAQFISQENDAAMSDVITKATEGMKFVQECARLLANAKKPVTWRSPIGLPIEQAYWKTKTKRVCTYWLSVAVDKHMARSKEGKNGKETPLKYSKTAKDRGIQARKAANSIAPNWVHSLDGSHAMFISLGMKTDAVVRDGRYDPQYLINASEKGVKVRKAMNGISANYVHSLDASFLMFTALALSREGVSNLTTVHDSFGSHASDIPTLHRVVRQTFVDMYKGQDRLAEWFTQIITAASDVDLDVALPERGSFDFDQVLESTYFCR
jgi:DNA-directed RNA polymerase